VVEKAAEVSAMSRTLSVQIPDEHFAALEQIAKREGVSAEHLGSSWLSAAIGRVAADPVMSLAGTLKTGTSDLASRHDQYLANHLDDELHGRET
jgi:hypothetical protein